MQKKVLFLILFATALILSSCEQRVVPLSKLDFYFSPDNLVRVFTEDDPYTGKAVLTSDQGVVLLEYNYRKGIKHGEKIVRYRNGEMKSQCFYENAFLNGEYKKWHANGLLKSLEVFDHDVLTRSIITDNFDYGLFEDNTYISSFFDFEIELPPGWIIHTKEQITNTINIAKDLMAGDDNNMKELLNAAEIDSAILLSVSQYKVAAAVTSNPSLIIVAENLKNTPGIKTGSDYLFHTSKVLKQSQIQLSYIDDYFEKRIIDEHDLYFMNTSINSAGQTIKQVTYSTILNGFGLAYIISYVTEEQRIILDEMIQSIKFSSVW